MKKKGLSIYDNCPMVILLYTIQRPGILRGLDRDAVIFTPTQLYHVPNYDGITGNISQSFTYEQLDIGNSVINVNEKEKFNIEDIYAVEMCKEIQRSYKAGCDNYEKEVKIALGNYIIRTVNWYLTTVPYKLTTVPYKETPITYTFK